MVIGGVVKGDIVSEDKVVILSTGMLIGNIVSPRLIAEEGVILNGVCTVSREDLPEETASPEPENRSEEDLDRYNPGKKVFSLWKG